MTMTRQNLLSDIRAQCVKANPEILKLEFGCEVLVEDEVMVATHWNTSNDTLDVYAPKRAEALHHTFNLYPKEWEIIGREIRLADVLLAIDFGVQVYSDHARVDMKSANLLEAWNLSRDSLTDQSTPTLQFLHDVLCGKDN